MAIKTPKPVTPETEPRPVRRAVKGTVVDWTTQTQVHPATGAKYDFDGKELK